MSGYIKLHRQLLDSYQFSNPDNLKIWIWLLLKANHKDKIVSVNIGGAYADVNIQRGQFIFGRTSAAKELNMHESKIYRVIKKLESDGSICIKSNNKYSIITICKFDDYNKKENEDEQQVNNRRTTGEQQVNTNNNDKKGKERKRKEKNKDSEPAASDGIYKSCMEIYDTFIRQQTGVGAQINSATGAALNKIIAYLKIQVSKKVDEEKLDFNTQVPHAFEFLFLHYIKWDAFHQKQLKLNQIESNLINIINSIKNGHAISTIKPKQSTSKYAAQ